MDNSDLNEKEMARLQKQLEKNGLLEGADQEVEKPKNSLVMTSGEEFKEPDKANYIFPNFLAKAMAKVDQRTQYEASMLSMTLICCGLILSVVYLLLYAKLALWYLVVLIINCLAGILFMSSYIITTFMQYKQLMKILEFQKELKGGP